MYIPETIHTLTPIDGLVTMKLVGLVEDGLGYGIFDERGATMAKL
jgi:hypothetical protein